MNSAGRLHAILNSAREVKAATTRQAWAKILGVNADDPVAVMGGLAQVLALLREIEGDLIRLDGHDKELHLAPLREIEAAFRTLNLEETWQQARQRLDPSAVRALAYTADALRLSTGVREIPPDTLRDLTEKIEALISELVDEELDPVFKAEILRYLDFARRALVHYRARGPEGLREALDLNLGLTLRRQDAWKASEPLTSGFRKLWLFLTELNTALSLAGYGLELAPAVDESVKRLLGGG